LSLPLITLHLPYHSHHYLLLFLSPLLLPPPRPTLFPYTTLFRSFPENIKLCCPLPHIADDIGLQVIMGAAGTCSRSGAGNGVRIDRKSTRLNSSHVSISYAVFCLKKKKRFSLL